MSIEIDTRITAALHPKNIESLDGVNEETLPVLGQVINAFTEAYSGLGAVHTAREAAKQNPSWTEAQQVMATQDLADKVWEKVAKRMDGTRSSLEAGIAYCEKELNAPIELRQSHPVSVEIRNYVRSLPSGDRMGFIKQAIDAGDNETAQACFSGPAYLSGLEPEMQQALLRLYREKANPAMARRLKALTSAKTYIEDRGGLVMKEMEKAVGMRPDQVQRLRNAKTKAEQAFVLKDVA